jgi:hypothetical protein
VVVAVSDGRGGFVLEDEHPAGEVPQAQAVAVRRDSNPTDASDGDYSAVLAMPEGTVVRDSAGLVWLIKRHRDETWLCPFSDEYAFMIKPDGTAYALSEVPSLPIVDTGLTSTGGA